MSLEGLKIVRDMNWKEAEMQIALHCAPLISGLTISNIICIEKGSVSRLNEILYGTDILYDVLITNVHKATILLYNKLKLEEHLYHQRVKTLLMKMGYTNINLQGVLKEFKKRFRKYMTEGTVFPHEMGILLGYPMEDVEGFINNDGRNFLYTGYWKVYGNVYEKMQMFNKIEIARDNILQLIACGINIREIIHLYKEKELQQIAV